MRVRGFALSGGGRAIIRVDISSDGGQTWQAAKLQPNNQKPYQSWSWTLWTANIPVKPSHSPSEIQLAVRAVDMACNSQPGDMAAIWNLRGVMNNAWHRVNVTINSAKSN